MEKEIEKDISTEELEKKIIAWRESYVKDINEYFLGRSYTDAIVAGKMIKSLVDDVQVLMQWCEILASKVKELENK